MAQLMTKTYRLSTPSSLVITIIIIIKYLEILTKIVNNIQTNLVPFELYEET